MVLRWPTVIIVVPMSLLLQCLVARDADPVAVARLRRFVIGVPSFVGRCRTAIGPCDSTATVVGHDGLSRPRFEDSSDVQDPDGCDGCGNRHGGIHYNSAPQQPQAAPSTAIVNQYDVLLAVILDIYEKHETLMRKLTFNHDDQNTYQWTVYDSI